MSEAVVRKHKEASTPQVAGEGGSKGNRPGQQGQAGVNKGMQAGLAMGTKDKLLGILDRKGEA